MKRFLIRSGISPLDLFDAPTIIARDAIGSNVGNLLYAYSIYRNLWTEDTEIIPDYYRIDPDDADHINETYDGYLIPLADAFRETFRRQLKQYTKLIKRLKIPVYIIGVGLRAPYEPDLKAGFPFDTDVKNFVKAVLEKTGQIGLRGEITSAYLTQLGFQAGVDHQVIGCPSMYTFGKNLTIKDITLNEHTKIFTNLAPIAPQLVVDFMRHGLQNYSDVTFIPQDIDELTLTYSGGTYLNGPSLGKELRNYPNNLESPEYRSGKVRFFLSAPSWIKAMKMADLSIGTRLHGNVAAAIAGTPGIIFPADARMRELSEFHGLTTYQADAIDENTTLSDILEQVDIHSPERKQAANFANFEAFLDKNQLSHIDFDSTEPAPLDKKLESVQLLPPVEPLVNCEKQEILQRLEANYPALKARNKTIQDRSAKTTKQLRKAKNELQTQKTEWESEKVELEAKLLRAKQVNQRLKAKLTAKNKKIRNQRVTLNRRSVKLALRIADQFRK
ncbi:Polysaccharide pyruvyl transferase [Listeria grayi]|uniref:Polysaccharide pyruvyl transferase domain-containing protein n=1 Tax=Listeria grayi FSL F6-1183 TaxID=1265827 RepID=A0A829R413_LISGR|nr:polysaccharide pyruvyl transferase family protein [Listeria grayi]EUJ26014.1 hypothetical protein LMUR_14034 [Listeria grayi FSL F6-1183]VEI36552.1 Polysaccharide pyruvyl transferase [Listeria grayi]